MRGEQRASTGPCCGIGGPSPRARGAGARRRPAGVLHGTIPACAGSSPAAPRRSRRAGDHPRVRGEQAGPSSRPSAPSGPSPRARGAVDAAYRERAHLGTIPACAGSSVVIVDQGQARRDHPRVRGEQPMWVVVSLVRAGPSPRARGAGCRASPLRAPSGDHPRVRGEQASLQRWTARHAGPSPRARGAAASPGGTPSPRGTIPACAGSSTGSGCPLRPRRDHPRVRGEQVKQVDGWPRREGPSPRARGAGEVTWGFRGARSGFYLLVEIPAFRANCSRRVALPSGSAAGTSGEGTSMAQRGARRWHIAGRGVRRTPSAARRAVRTGSAGSSRGPGR